MFNSLKFQRFKIKRKAKIWQLFHATDFESLMYPCFTFCRILGIFPYKIYASTIKTSKPYYILWIVITCVFCVYDVINLYEMNVYKKFVFKSGPRTLERNCFFILGGFITVMTFIFNGQRKRLLEIILKLSLRVPQKSYQNLSRLIHAKDIFGFSFIFVQLLICFFSMQSDTYKKILMAYIILLMFQIDMLYMNCVCVLKVCFKQINDYLANLRKLVANGEPYLLKWGTHHEQKNSFLLMELKAVKKQHLAICDTVQMLNTTFCLQLLSTIIMAFIEITFNMYFYLVRKVQGDTSLLSELEKQVYYESFIVFGIHHIMKIVLIAWACETGKNQAIEINTTVHDLHNSISDEEIKYELRLFSLQLMHRKNIFSAKGLSVDATLLSAMAGGITTYILIMIQFLVMSNLCNKNF